MDLWLVCWTEVMRVCVSEYMGRCAFVCLCICSMCVVLFTFPGTEASHKSVYIIITVGGVTTLCGRQTDRRLPSSPSPPPPTHTRLEKERGRDKEKSTVCWVKVCVCAPTLRMCPITFHCRENTWKPAKHTILLNNMTLRYSLNFVYTLVLISCG